ncbi:hypothetical protein H4219_001873 [Mycoemilia scoparia]|uniref:Uncharacterized protein n=1 Tax=Mycoemilia scoparia TaxID=417184 RepID=A0A9W8DRC6_9FUNG|nr:hypothetical protein H4219_001873 [Mycoemilia scoparia]
MLSRSAVVLATLATFSLAAPQATTIPFSMPDGLDFGGDNNQILSAIKEGWGDFASYVGQGLNNLKTANPELYSQFANVIGTQIPSTFDVNWLNSVQNINPSDVAKLEQALSTISDPESYLGSIFGSLPTGLEDSASGSDDDDDDKSDSHSHSHSGSESDSDSDSASDSVTSSDESSKESASSTKSSTSKHSKSDSKDDSSETSDSEGAASGLKVSIAALAGSLIAFNALF